MENKSNKNSIQVKITTQSNVSMGGADGRFEIGGIDESTVVDFEGKPYIPASSFKGMVRKIIRDHHESEEAGNVIEILTKFLEADKKIIIEEINEKCKRLGGKTEEEKGKEFKKIKETIEKKYTEIKENLTVADLLGVSSFQRMPKLLFSDFILEEGQKDLFSIDMKNTIIEQGQDLTSNPRTYRTIRKGICFTGEIIFYNFDKCCEKDVNMTTMYIKEMIEEFNGGVYRIGNSKSRGYGKIKVEVL